MVLFGLMATLLFVISGLAIDAGESYLVSDRAERAAAAAALAGVAYLPGNYTSAQQVANVESARNGFRNQGSNNSCSAAQLPCVITAQPATNQLTVTITVNVSTTFLRIIGFGNHTVVRSATAEYLPPIELGQPGAQQGSELSGACDGAGGSPYCTSPTSGLGSGSNNYYFERTEGWGNPRSQGDPYDPSPLESGAGCGNACTASPPDAHLISPFNGTDISDTTLDYQGGSNYLIDVPAHQKAAVQIFNPSFAPDSHDQSGGYTYHEDDGSFTDGSTTATDYSATSYTIYSVSTLSSRLSDTKQVQEIFYPFNATGLYTYGTTNSPSYYYFPHGGTGTATTVTGWTPTMYHAWTDAINFTSGNANDQALFTRSRFNGFGANFLDNSSGTTDKYWRLRVDDMNWNGTATCSASTCTTPDTATPSTDGSSKAHKGYAVRVTTVPGQSACNGCTISAMGDMTVYTPISAGGANSEFSIPLFKLDPAYAGHSVIVDMFDPGDVGGGAAYMGLQLPNSTTWATATSLTTVGTSLKSGTSTPVTSLGTWPGPTGGACSACYQTAGATGGSLYNGQWIQMTIDVPQTFDSTGYFNLVYDLAAGGSAGDTFGVQVGYPGSPDHLLP